MKSDIKKILVLNFFPAFTPPSSGGELRYFHMHQQLSRYYDVTLLSPTYGEGEFEIITHSETFREYRVPKEDIHDELHHKLDKQAFVDEISALVCALAGACTTSYHHHYLTLYPEVDLIIHDHPFMLDYDLFFGIDEKPRIYNSHNLEYNLASQVYQKPQGQAYMDYIHGLEERMVMGCDLVLAASEDEKKAFSQIYSVDPGKIRLAPNGINPEDLPKRNQLVAEGSALFIGSAHPPNFEAVDFIVANLADQCPEITFIVAGACCDGRKTDKLNVKLLGKVDDRLKSELFSTSDIAINPMFSGAGTNLKTLEFLSMGIPLISTDVGARGLDLIDGTHFIKAGSQDFAEKIISFIKDKDLKKKLSKNAQFHINKTYAWERIACTVHLEIENLAKNPARPFRKTLVLLNDFEASHPFGGGEVRINQLYSALSRKYNIILVCLNNSTLIRTTFITPTFLEISIPKTKDHIREEQRVNNHHLVSAGDVVSSYMIRENRLYLKVVEAAAVLADWLVFIHPYMVDAALSLPDHIKQVYESLNYELGLKQSLLKDHPLGDELIGHVARVEKKCCCASSLIISVSDDDHAGLIACSQKPVCTVLNGVAVNHGPMFTKVFSGIKALFSGHPVVVFIGSGHYPNVLSARFILDDLSKELSECYFLIVGSVCTSLGHGVKPENVILCGQVENDEKNILLKIADIGINPVMEGSGSNLKLGEYFSWDLPVVTTPFGARGYDIHDGKEAVICGLESFAKAVRHLIKDQSAARRIAKNAVCFAMNNLDWQVLAKKYSRCLEYTEQPERKRILILTYRFTLPPKGGAEVYLYELIKELDRLNHYDITVAALDSDDILNQYHFGIRFTRDGDTYQHEFENVIIKKFPVDDPSDARTYESALRLMKIRVEEGLLSARRFVDLYDGSLLMGGWYFPEKTETGNQIWSSPRAEIYIKDTDRIKLSGYSPKSQILVVTLNGRPVYKDRIKGRFVIELKDLTQGTLTIECEETVFPEDARSLGLLIHSIRLINNRMLDLDQDYRLFLKHRNLSGYIDEMIAVAKARPRETDALFQSTRGLNSSALEAWLTDSIKDFHLVMGHSIPFATTPITARYAEEQGVPCVLLPHFHYDDEFYHWQSYYQAMGQADIVFASPKVSVSQFYDKLNIRTIVVPGGGINPGEYENVSDKFFRALYPSETPFFLVLGRKSGAKNYQSVVQAVEQLNIHESICNLVMIGRNEDHLDISSKQVTYLGEQSRDVVLGALKTCNGLITMSRSESFGIVILEAWMFQKPVIVNQDCPAFLELVQDGENGIYAADHNLAEKINILLEHPELGNRLGLNGHKKIHQYTWSHIAEKLEGHFREVWV